MKLLVACLALVLVSCRSSGLVHVGPDPQEGHGFRAVAHINGDFDGQTFAESIPTSALVRAHGDFTVTLRAWPAPFLVVDGTADVIVEPLPGREAEAMAAVRAGHIMVRRNGVPGDLNPPGTRAAKIAGLIRASRAAKAAGAVSSAKETPPEPVALCVGEDCILPPPMPVGTYPR